MRHPLLSRRLVQASALALLTAVSACSEQEPAAQAPLPQAARGGNDDLN